MDLEISAPGVKHHIISARISAGEINNQFAAGRSMGFVFRSSRGKEVFQEAKASKPAFKKFIDDAVHFSSKVFCAK